jgi:hypothetical protein
LRPAPAKRNAKRRSEKEAAVSSEKIFPSYANALLCDEVRRGEAKRPSLLNIIDTLQMPGLPGNAPIFWAFMQMFGGVGAFDLTFGIQHLETGQQITGPPIPVTLSEESSPLCIAIPVRQVPLSQAGKHEFQFLLDGRVVARTGFFVRSPAQSSSPDQ